MKRRDIFVLDEISDEINSMSKLKGQSDKTPFKR